MVETEWVQQQFVFLYAYLYKKEFIVLILINLN